MRGDGGENGNDSHYWPPIHYRTHPSDLLRKQLAVILLQYFLAEYIPYDIILFLNYAYVRVLCILAPSWH